MEESPPKRRSERAAALVCKEKLRLDAGSSRQKKLTASQSDTCSQRGFLFDLPQGVLEDILHKAGLHSRALCKALAHLYGPLHCLTPRGLSSTSDLNTILRNQARRTLLLHTLDLQFASHLVTDHSLKVLSKALPTLQELRLPFALKLTADGLSSAQPLLSSLTALHLASCTRLGPLALDPISALTALRELTLPTTTTPPDAPTDPLTKLSACTQLSKLAFSELDGDGTLELNTTAVVACAQLLPALVSLRVNAHYLEVDQHDLAQLQRLTQLTELHLSLIEDTEGVSVAGMLQAVGAMTRLRALQLRLLHTGWTAAERGWLTRLTLLTSLDVQFCFIDRTMFNDLDDDDENEVGAFDEVASAVPHLPALRELRLSSDTQDPLRDLLEELNDAPFARLAAAATSLRALQLLQLNLSDTCMDVLRQLTALTSLSVCSCDGLDHFDGLAELTNLRELRFELLDEIAPEVEQLGALTGLHALALRGDFMQRTYLTRLCAALPQLRELDISGNYEIGAGVNALKRLACLEVVDLTATVEVEKLKGLKPPKSLRRCFLGHVDREEERERARRLLGPGVDVVFGGWQHKWWEPLHLRGYDS